MRTSSLIGTGRAAALPVYPEQAEITAYHASREAGCQPLIGRRQVERIVRVELVDELMRERPGA